MFNKGCMIYIVAHICYLDEIRSEVAPFNKWKRMKAKHCLESNPVVGFAASPWLFTCNHNQKVNLRRMPLANTRSGSLNTRHGIEGTELSLFAFLISRHLHVLLCCRVASRYLYHYSKTVLLLVHRFFRHTLEM